mgnify:CR=1 FL=1
MSHIIVHIFVKYSKKILEKIECSQISKFLLFKMIARCLKNHLMRQIRYRSLNPVKNGVNTILIPYLTPRRFLGNELPRRCFLHFGMEKIMRCQNGFDDLRVTFYGGFLK